MLPDDNETIFLGGMVALVTGAGSGIGRSVAKTLASSGAAVAANDLTPMNVEEVVGAIRARGDQASAYVEDLTRGMPIRDLLDRVIAAHGRLDILVNAAQVRHPAGLLEMDEWDWQRTLDVNLSGPFLLAQAAARHMQFRGGGVIINIGVDAISAPAVSGLPAYYAGKSGLAALSRAAAHELLAYNIRIFAICVDEAHQPLTGDVSEGSLQIHELVSKIAILLCSPKAAQFSGQVFRINGV
jgi:NAD(P)-dependent dehydrogenase (short-subunit alcohol dehydrogenase family)